jgi:hypothetical protein
MRVFQFRMLAATVLAVVAMSARANAQSTVSQPAAKPTSAECESILATARLDSVPGALFISVRDVDGDMEASDERRMALMIGVGFTPPKPLRLAVFAGPARTHILRPIGGDTSVDLRGPSITSTVRVTSVKGESLRLEVIRGSMIIGFDSSVVAAIRSASIVSDMFMPEDEGDTLRVDVRVATDSITGAKRLITANFPRVPIVDAIPLSTPALVFPEQAKADGLTRGEVVLRMVVNRDGTPEIGTVEIVRETASSFVKAALESLPKQRFRPATVKGCPVPQVIDFPFAFVQPEKPSSK